MARLKGYLISERVICELVAEANDLQDVTISRVWYDPEQMSFVVVFESPMFEEVPECCRIPIVF